MKNQNGFTLLELTIVLAILGILTAVATFPYSRNAAIIRINQAGEDISSSMNLIRSKAISRGTNFGLNFREKDNRIYLTRFEDRGSITGQLDTDDLTEGEYSLSPEIKLAAVAKPITFKKKTAIFTPFGTANGGKISLEDGQGNKLSVIVLSNTGRIRVERN